MLIAPAERTFRVDEPTGLLRAIAHDKVLLLPDLILSHAAPAKRCPFHGTRGSGTGSGD
jgi:hypothetical protein